MPALTTAFLAAILLLRQAPPAAAPPPMASTPGPGAPPAEGRPGGEAREAVLDARILFSEANRAFDEAKTDDDLLKAASRYQELLDRGLKNGHLYYNLGNTCLRLKDYGKAILSFRRALLYQPDHPYASDMLDFARRQLPSAGRFDTGADGVILKTLFFWHYRLPFTTRLAIFNGLFLAFWAVLLIGLYRRFPFRRFTAACLFIAAAAFGFSLAAQTLLERGFEAVVTAKEVEVRSGSGPGFDLVFKNPIPGGVEVKVLESRGLWLFVEFPGGTVGWVQAGGVEEVGR